MKAQEILERIAAQELRRFLPDDPISLVRPYSRPEDRETAAFLAALLAFGNARAIIGSAGRLLAALGPNPYDRIRSGEWREGTGGVSLGHRWVRREDLLLLLEVLEGVFQDHPGLEGFLLETARPGPFEMGPALDAFSKRMRAMAGRPAGRGFRYFFPSPRDGSACKRLCLFLRWVVRPDDGIDLGLWRRISPANLVIPLDIHVTRFARRFRLSRVRSPGWRMAVQVTDFLKRLDPADPLKYDFAICHAGMARGRATRISSDF